MEEFKTYLMEDLIEEIAMGPFGSNIKVDCFVDSGVPVLNGANLQGFKLREDSFNYVTTEKADSLNKANAYRGDIVITHRGTLGQIVYIPNDSKYERYVISQSQFRVRVNPEVALPEYVVFYFHTRVGQHRLLANASQVGVPAIARPSTTFKKVEIELPSLKEQKRIVGILNSLSDKIDLNNRINHNLEEQAKALYKSWFVDFEPFRDGQFVDSELGIIPKGWRVGTLSELGDIVAGGTPSKAKPEYYTNKGISWLTPKDLSVKCNKFTARGETDITEEGYKNSSAKLMPRGSILFSSRAPIGYISIAKGTICTNQGFKSVVPTYAGTAYVYYWLRENTDAIESQASGSTFKEASGSLMKSFPALVPEKSVLDSFEKEIAPILNEQEILEEQIYHAEQIRDSLLPRLMSGELVMNC